MLEAPTLFATTDDSVVISNYGITSGNILSHSSKETLTKNPIEKDGWSKETKDKA